MNNQVEEAVKVLNQGGIVIFPTDTAYGIGCRIDNEEAIKKLFKIRKRPKTQAVPVLVSGIEMARRYFLPLSEDVGSLMNKYWPGALTIVYGCREEKVPSLVRGNGNTLGVRIPDNETMLSIIKGIGVGILGPSANFHGKKTPYEYADLDPKLTELADYVVKGECSLKKPSTVIDCSQKPWKILRAGALKIKI